MSKPMRIDFTVDVPSLVQGELVADEARGLGYEIDLDRNENSDRWTCRCTKLMLATYEGVVAAQAELEAISRPLGGHCDGWGTFGNAD
jgi:hypothetical protein